MKKVREYKDVVAGLESASKEIPGLSLNRLGTVRSKNSHYDFFSLRLGDGDKEVCLSGGIHGNEPSGVETIQAFLRGIKKNSLLLSRFHFFIFPCNNPFGYEYNLRENEAGLDLNRQYGKVRPSEEVQMIRQVLDKKQFDLSMEFHEDVDTDGYYLYELSLDTSVYIGKKIIQKISKQWPVNMRKEIEGAPSRGGVISPQGAGEFFKKRVSRMRQCPQAIWLYKKGTRRCITSETPVTLPMSERVAIHLTALDVALENV